MGSAYQIKIIYVVKLINHFVAEDEAGASRVDAPGADIVGIAPHHIAKRPVVGDLNVAVDQPRLVDGLHLRRQAAVDAKNAVFNQGSYR